MLFSHIHHSLFPKLAHWDITLSDESEERKFMEDIFVVLLSYVCLMADQLMKNSGYILNKPSTCLKCLMSDIFS